MNYILHNHNHVDDIVTTIMMFYPNEKYNLINFPEGLTVLSALNDRKAFAAFYDGVEEKASFELDTDPENEKSVRYALRVAVYRCLMQVRPIKAPWGVLTGVRPAKIVWNMWDMGCKDKEIKLHKFSGIDVKAIFTDNSLNLSCAVNLTGELIPTCINNVSYLSFFERIFITWSFDIKRFIFIPVRNTFAIFRFETQFILRLVFVFFDRRYRCFSFNMFRLFVCQENDQ